MEAGKAAAIDDSSPLADAKPESADVVKAAKPLPRLPEHEVMFLLMTKNESCESDSPEVKRLDAEHDEFREHVRQEYMSKGYVEVDEDYFERRNVKEAWLAEECKNLDFSRLPTADYMADEHLRSLIQFPWDD